MIGLDFTQALAAIYSQVENDASDFCCCFEWLGQNVCLDWLGYPAWFLDRHLGGVIDCSCCANREVEV